MGNEEALQLLKDVINVKTVDSNEKAVADILEKALNDHGIPTEQIVYNNDPSRTQLVAMLEGTGSGKTLAFSGHMDVVPEGDAEWTTPAFNADVRDGKLYGRGAADMKSGLVASVVAVINLKESGADFNGTVKLLLTDAEEVGLKGAHELTIQGYADDVDAIVIGEATNSNIGIAHKGGIWLDIKAYGKAAHSSRPETGINAIDKLGDLIPDIKAVIREELDKVEDPNLGKSTLSLNVFKGGEGMNVVPDYAEVTLDSRLVPGVDADVIFEKVKAFLEEQAEKDHEFKFDIQQKTNIKPVSTDADDPFVVLAKSVTENVVGREIELYNMTGATDAAEFVAAGDFPVIILGPGASAQTHQVDEYVELEQYYQIIEIYERLAKEYLN